MLLTENWNTRTDSNGNIFHKQARHLLFSRCLFIPSVKEVIFMAKGDVKPGPTKNTTNTSKKDSRKKGRSGPKKREK